MQVKVSDDDELRQLGIVDTHCHMWRFEVSADTWLPSEFEPWRRTFEPSDLADESRAIGVQMCVLVEAGTTPEERVVLEEMAGFVRPGWLPHCLGRRRES